MGWIFLFQPGSYLELPVRARRIPHTKGDIRLPLEAGLINYDLGESHSPSALNIFWYVCVLVCCRAKRWTPHVGFELQSCPEELSSGGSTWVRQRAMLPLMVHPCLGNLERSTWSTTGGGGSRPRFQRWTKAAMSAQQQRRVRF